MSKQETYAAHRQAYSRHIAVTRGDTPRDARRGRARPILQNTTTPRPSGDLKPYGYQSGEEA